MIPNSINWENEKNKLYDLIINKKLSYKSIGKLYNCSDVTIKKHAFKLIPNLPSRKHIHHHLYCKNCGKEITTKKHYKGRLYCNNKCQNEYKSKLYINDWQFGKIDGLKGNKIDLSGYIRNYLLKKVGYKCEICGWNSINKFTGLCPLNIHHKDGNSLNNKEENLQVLCPNCHSLTENYGSRNKNACKERTIYHMAKWKKDLYNKN